MLIIPYSTALTLAKPPVVTYATTFLCIVIFHFQLNSSITESLMYYPDSWNPLTMISASIAHAGWTHLLGNLVFFLAFAPALEILIGNTVRYISLLLFISFVVGISYSVSTLTGHSEPLPSLGLSGVVMGMIGLSAFMMPQAKIRVFWWYIIFWKTFYVPVWIIAIAYIGMDSWEMFTSEDFRGINVVAHVAGGIAGYLFGQLWLKQRREETRDELATEIEQMRLEKIHGKSTSMSFRRSNELAQQKIIRDQQKKFDRFMGHLYKAVTTHRDSEAVYLLMENYDRYQTPVQEYEQLFERIKDWGSSRTLLCLGRVIIDILNEERRYGRALYYIEKCLQISPQFILPDVSHTLFYAKMAFDTDKQDVAKNLINDAEKRYGNLVNIDLCKKLSAGLKLEPKKIS